MGQVEAAGDGVRSVTVVHDNWGKHRAYRWEQTARSTLGGKRSTRVSQQYLFSNAVVKLRV